MKNGVLDHLQNRIAIFRAATGSLKVNFIEGINTSVTEKEYIYRFMEHYITLHHVTSFYSKLNLEVKN